MFEASADGAPETRTRIVELFLDQHLHIAADFGWSDVELFGCYPDRAFALVRYDCMGAVTIAALTRSRIVEVTDGAIRDVKGLASRRPLTCQLPKPVWLVFDEGTD